MKKTIKMTLASSVVLMLLFVILEPQLTKAVSDSVTVSQSVTAEITISSPSDVTMSSIAGITGGTGTGSAIWNVKTNNSTGFNMALKAGAAPALASGGNNFADYGEATPDTPDYTWSIAATDSEFGYTVEPATAGDATVMFRDNGTTTCGTGANQTADKCWIKFKTTDVIGINRSSVTTAAGEDEVVKFQAQSGASHFQPQGTYTATITATALVN
jgi:hypothetical protein